MAQLMTRCLLLDGKRPPILRARAIASFLVSRFRVFTGSVYEAIKHRHPTGERCEDREEQSAG
jgi:hypothetical protein